VLLAWSVPAVLGVPFAIGSLATAPAGLAPWRVLVVLAATWGVWALMTIPVLALTDRVTLERPLRLQSILAHTAACVAACATQAVVTALVFRALMVATPLAPLMTTMLLRFAPAGVLAYAAIVAARMSQTQRARAAAREAEAQELARRLVEAELMALRAQLRPHFLFNALNATVALVRDGQSARAADTLLSLSALLRAMLRGNARHEVSLAEELEFVEQYLAIERLRMGERLRVQVDVPPTLRSARVPALCVQPLVENAVLHGLRNVPGDAHITVSARSEQGVLVLRVTDDGAGLPSAFDPASHSGLGIGNTRARLALLYGERAAVRLGAGSDGRGTTAEITLPLSLGAA
jgi:LytS/YehU family sensor histidine kinase